MRTAFPAMHPANIPASSAEASTQTDLGDDATSDGGPPKTKTIMMHPVDAQMEWSLPPGRPPPNARSLSVGTTST